MKDEKTGIVLETNTGILDKNATLSVDVLTKGSDYDFALRALSDVDAKWSLYNIVTLLNGAKTDPSGAVVLRIPCSNADGYVVYLINADGSKTKLNGIVQDGYFVVRTRSLGLIAVGTANSGGNNDNSGNPGIPGNPSSPQTGDNNNGGSGNSGNNDNNNNVSESPQTGVNTTPVNVGNDNIENVTTVNNGSIQSTQTGDIGNQAIWFLLTLASGGTMIVLMLGRKRKNRIGE